MNLWSRLDKRLKTVIAFIAAVLACLWLAWLAWGEYLIKSADIRQSMESADIVFLSFMIFAVLMILLVPAVSGAFKVIRALRMRALSPVRAKKMTPRELSFGIFSLVLCFLLFILFWYVKFTFYVKHLEGYEARTSPSYKAPETPGVNPRQLLDLGWAHSPDSRPDCSYTMCAREKKPHAIRIGVFGCSFVFGTEVARGHEFPTWLQRRFQEAGIPDVEVLNFGVRGYGVHQAYLMWKEVGRAYDLDYAVFFPMEIHECRDRGFIYRTGEYSPVHARFIVEHGDLKLIGVLGISPLDATRKYYQFITPWRYLRYDEKGPASLCAIIPSRGRELNNPFYYVSHNNKKHEILETYALIFNEVAAGAKNAVVIVEDKDMRSLRSRVSSSHLTFLDGWSPHLRNSFLYKAPAGHHSALGQKLQSDELFSFLTGKDSPTFDYIEIEKDAHEPAGTYEAQPLYEYDRVSVAIGKSPVAHFGLPTESHSAFAEPCCNRPLDFQKSRICSLLLQTDGRAIRFIPLTFPLDNASSAFLSIDAGNRILKMPIGIVRARGGVIGRLMMKPGSSLCAGEGGRIEAHARFDATEMPDGVIVQDIGERIRQLTITVGDDVVLRGRELPVHRLINALRRFVLFRRPSMMVYHYRLEPVNGDYSYLKAGPGEYVDFKGSGEQTGTVDILLTDAQERTVQIPAFLRYRFFQQSGPPFSEVLNNPIR